MDKKMKIIALIALLVYVISPVDLAPGPMDDMVMCLLYAIMNYKTISNEVLDEKPESWPPNTSSCKHEMCLAAYRTKKRIPRHECHGIRFL